MLCCEESATGEVAGEPQTTKNQTIHTAIPVPTNAHPWHKHHPYLSTPVCPPPSVQLTPRILQQPYPYHHPRYPISNTHLVRLLRPSGILLRRVCIVYGSWGSIPEYIDRCIGLWDGRIYTSIYTMRNRRRELVKVYMYEDRYTASGDESPEE